MEYDKNKDQVRFMHGAIDFSGKDILEIGCGNGSVSTYLAKGSGSYIAVDPDPAGIAQAKQLDTEINFQTGTGQALDFPDNCFDLVLFTLSLHHQESASALEEAFRVLKPGNHVLVVEPNARGEFELFFNLFDDETQALEAAEAAIRSSRFTLKNEDHFQVTASFESIQDLCEYDFNRELPGPADNQKILDLLCRVKSWASPAHIPDDPIDLVDELRVFLLEKPLS
ncbi:class I SAM-dependent methyltransferase [Desulfospira joergensenii]|uniref:class I SAM-dependent methyltransferase n=1 Tax=Desulfospira joergensenii TaxID=53329 RepID=UPI0003B70681|nr:class I SAM-dependent methyltransferase [Desulfospira joergensenii]